MLVESAAGAGYSGCAALQSEAAEDRLQVRLHGIDGAAQDDGHLVVGLPLRDPVEDLCLSWGEGQLLLEDLAESLLIRRTGRW